VNRLVAALGEAELRAERVTHVEVTAARDGAQADWPDWSPDWLREGCARLGIARPWVHQVEAMQAGRAGHCVIATATGSGKSLALWTPVLAALDQPYELGRVTQVRSRASAIYVAPTKALAADQEANLRVWLKAAEVEGLEVFTCDGDTPAQLRRLVRARADVVLTNPDFLHFSLLGDHARWAGFLRGLRYVIVDELHAYRGVMGAHVAWVARRLRRLARRYGADPVFLAASATVSEPESTLARLIGEDPSAVAVVNQDTAASGERTFVLWRPPSDAADDHSADAGSGAAYRPRADAAAGSGAAYRPRADAAAAGAADAAGSGAADAAGSGAASRAADAADAAGSGAAGAAGAAGRVRADSYREKGGEEQAGGSRRSAPAEAARLLADLVKIGARTLVFVRSRYSAESVANAARQLVGEGLAGRVATYRGGYLPEERRDLEERLRSGALLGLVSTSALELGIDVAGLDAVITAGWPGTRIALRQQAGRAGRAGGDGLAVWVAGRDPLDSYLVNHPQALVAAPLEATVFDPSNPYVAAPHLAAAAAEWPLEESELPELDESAPAVVESLSQTGALRRRGGRWFWVAAERATDLTDLRGAGGGLVQVVESETGRILGTVDSASAPAAVHPGAVYLHQGATFLVTDLDLDGAVALVKAARPPYRTMPLHRSTVRVVERKQSLAGRRADWHFGLVDVTAQVTGFMRLRPPGLKRIDTARLDMPQSVLRTAATWVVAPPETLAEAGLDESDVPGALHAAEHACIGLLPLLATCDRWDLGGLSTASHPDTGAATIFIHDAVPGGAGFAERAFQRRADLLAAVRALLEQCPCEDGCPSCVQSPKCGNGNQTLSKPGALALVATLVKDHNPTPPE
jgi:DEAD/DEAH box helicase domain-containing protein